MPKESLRFGFLEVMIVVVVIGILAGIAIPRFSGGRLERDNRVVQIQKKLSELGKSRRELSAKSAEEAKLEYLKELDQEIARLELELKETRPVSRPLR